MTPQNHTHIKDLYPTRQNDHTQVFSPQGPVVHGTAEQGPMDAATLKHFEDNGYLTIDQLMTPDELETFRAELKRLATDPESRADERTIIEAKSDGVRSDIHRTSEIFRSIANDPGSSNEQSNCWAQQSQT